MSQPKKQSFLHGTVLLAASAALVKVIGALYKIPLNAIIGEQGFSYFNTAYDIYSMLLAISVAGLPLAMSRLISEASALGHYNQVRRVYRTARALYLVLGFVGSLLMVLFCKPLARFQEQPDAWFAIACLGPALLLIGIMSSFRGFFQGQGNMTPTAVSQVLEAVFKLIIGMVAALLLLQLTSKHSFAAGGAILGVTASCVFSVIYLFFCYRKAKRTLPVTDEPVSSYGSTLKKLLAIAIPVTIGSSGLSLLALLETKIYMGQLINLGYSQDQADVMKGVYDMARTLYNMPMAFITPISVSIVPAITAYLATNEHKEAKATGESALRIMSLIIVPCMAGLAVMAEPVMALLGGYEGNNLSLSTALMTILSIAMPLHSMVLITNAIMQGHGRVNLPVINMFIGGLIKLVCTSILSSNPHLGIMGAPISAIIGYSCIMTLNIFTLRRCTPNAPAILRQIVRPMIAALVMAGIVLACRLGLEALFNSDSFQGILSSNSLRKLILTALPIMVGVAAYAFSVVKFKAITREDCMLLPKGDKIANLLHL